MKKTGILLLLLLFAGGLDAAEPKGGSPFDAGGAFSAVNDVDRAVLKGLRKVNISPAGPCSDEVFLRRVTLDLTGSIPDPAEVVSFLEDKRRGKRAALVERLFETDAFADYQTLRWCDVLRVKAEFPINLWPNAVQAYYRYLRESIRQNRPFDQFARELLTTSGSNFRDPAVNFYRAVSSRDPAALAQAVALTFMGSRIETWPEERRDGFAAFFSRVAFKRTKEWKEEIVFPDPTAQGTLTAVFPDGTVARIAPDEDPREVLASWLLAPGNPWFARAAVNRMWAWLLGRGIVHEPDDFRPDNPPSNPDLLETLEKAFVKSGYDLRALIRLIVNSATYQQSPVPKSRKPEVDSLFGHYLVRQLDAEVLIDAICAITGTQESYMSPIPEPFTYVPEADRTIALTDGSITSPFLEMFGRPARDTGLDSERNSEPTDGQRLHLLNSRDISGRVTQSVRIRRIFTAARGNPREAAKGIWVLILSRYPTDEEMTALGEYVRTSGLPPAQAGMDIVWALLNSKEFLFRH